MWCGSARIVKNGHKPDGQQLWKCKECGHQFIENGCPPRMRTSSKAVALAHEFFFEGTSLRKTRRILEKATDNARHHTSILRWLTKYPDLVQPFLSCFPAETSGVWHADETAIKLKNGEQGKLADHWTWNVMDGLTRFHLASMITEWGLKDEQAIQLFRMAKAMSKENSALILTDGLGAYNKGVSKVFYNQKPEKRANHEVVPAFGPNAIIERYHGTYKDRYKVMRGFKNPPSASAPNLGWSIHYNYLREHSALDGATPAEAAQIDLPFKDGWGDFIPWATHWQTLLTDN